MNEKGKLIRILLYRNLNSNMNDEQEPLLVKNQREKTETSRVSFTILKYGVFTDIQ